MPARTGYDVDMAKTPINRETVKRLIDALTPMNPETAEKFVQDLLRAADERRKEVERVVGDVAKAGVRTAEGLATSVQHELGRQMTKMATRIDDLERQVDSLSKALESTRSNLLALASRSMAKGGSDGSTEGSDGSKPSKKNSKKSEKKSKRAKNRSKDSSSAAGSGSNETTAELSSSADRSDGAPAVAGI